jgi:hypothetical protein
MDEDEDDRADVGEGSEEASGGVCGALAWLGPLDRLMLGPLPGVVCSSVASVTPVSMVCVTSSSASKGK